ncbi:MAG TPA: TIGR04053 family radical SAM/SPASM domain-containing protein [Gemmatimonadaceae bacterium]|nr:TIGR04053 family radical SAM/SPASM domain-containing protein [Gemmatimonadaceae bacterium]
MPDQLPAAPPERPSLAATDFDRAPFLVIWEMTQACDLACRHCRALARPWRDHAELTTAEAKQLVDSVCAFGRPLFVLTGGDPLKRPDTVPIVEYAARAGLRVALTPSGTPLMTRDVLQSLRDAGLARLAVSLDGSTALIHDRFRGVAGSFEWTLRMLEAARELQLPTQVNTTISHHNVDDLEGLITLMARLGIVLWSVFFIVPTGRARSGDLTTADEFERVFHRLYDFSRTAPFDIKTTAAPHYRRVVLQRQVAERRAAAPPHVPPPLAASPGFSLGDDIGRAKGVNDGNGFLFVSHRGEIYPSGFLPLSAGNVRTRDLATVYRESALFRALRDPDRLEGKCGVCEFRVVCGGSRARAFAMTGNPLASDPSCAYIPPRWNTRQQRGEGVQERAR